MSTSERLYLGIDGGGSKTSAWLGCCGADNSLSIVGKATGGPSNVRALGLDAALHNVEQTIAAAYREASREATPASRACISLAGAGREAEQQEIQRWCSTKNIAREVTVAGDAEVILAAAASKEDQAPDQQGISLIAGTGSMAWGQKEDCTARSGGWGYLLGDEGSGFSLGQQFLRLVVRDADGLADADELAESLARHLKLKSPDEIVAWCYGADDPRSQIASLAPLVFELLHHQSVEQIIADGARQLALLVHSVAQKLDFRHNGFLLAYAGSVLVHQSHYVTLITNELVRLGTPPATSVLVRDPVLGALRIAANG